MAAPSVGDIWHSLAGRDSRRAGWPCRPMITGVVTMLAGEALFHGSREIAIWVVTFTAINQIYFVLLEEPGLERRFGAAYLEYKSAVPRWIPRTTPWKNT